jgi:hypothetical protein
LLSALPAALTTGQSAAIKIIMVAAIRDGMRGVKQADPDSKSKNQQHEPRWRLKTKSAGHWLTKDTGRV